MTVKMILAVDHGGSIGWSDGTLPWKITPDMARFKALTTGHTVLMGRKTFESLKRPNGLPNRENFVLSRRQIIGDVSTISSLDDVRDLVKTRTHRDIWIIGGTSIYKQAIDLQLVDEIYLTQVHAQSGGDVVLPFDLWDWKLFVLHERARGVHWEVEGEEVIPPVPLDCPPIAYIKLTKVK